MPRSAVGVTERRSNLNLAWSLTWRNEIAAAAGLLPKRKHKFCCSSERNIFCPVSAFSFHEHQQQRLHTPAAAYTRGGAWNDEDKSAPGFFIIQRIIISCLRMAKGGIHPRIGLQSVMTGYSFLVNIIILLVLIRQIRGHYDADVLHHHGGRQCSHQHPKAHEVRSDYDFTYHSSSMWFHKFCACMRKFPFKNMVMPHVTKKHHTTKYSNNKIDFWKEEGQKFLRLCRSSQF